MAFNPLDEANLARSVVKALEEEKLLPLSSLSRFEGAGIYAIFYTGPFAPYADLVAANCQVGDSRPIYIGKAVRKGTRKGITTTGASFALHDRLDDHKKSIEAATNLDLADFEYRALAVSDIWIPLAETTMIAMYAPVWNRSVDGFGNHDPGKGRKNSIRSRWDTLHPGRSWATPLTARRESSAAIAAEVKVFLSERLF